MTAEPGGGSIQSVLVENRVFPPPADFARSAHVSSLEQYQQLWDRARDDPDPDGPATVDADAPVEDEPTGPDPVDRAWWAEHCDHSDWPVADDHERDWDRLADEYAVLDALERGIAPC